MSVPSALFTATDLGAYLHREVTDADASMAERVVWGWLKPALGLTDRPDPVPEDVFSWAIELGAIAYENPSPRGRRQLGSLVVEPPSERREAILEEAGSSASTAPQGAFPPASRYPDPVVLPRASWW